MRPLLSMLALVMMMPWLHGCGVELMHAADRGDTAAVSSLLDQAHDPNTKLPIAGTGPLILAAAKGHLDVIRVLLDHGADVNDSDRTGWTPLHAAIYGGHADVVQLLLDRGARIDRTGRWYLVGPIELAESLVRDSEDRKKVVDVLRSFESKVAARSHPP